MSFMLFILLVLGAGNTPLQFVDEDAYWAKQNLAPDEAELRQWLKPTLRAGPLEAEELEALLTQLAANDFLEREAAERKLVEVGPRLRPQIEALGDQDDPELRFRAQRILKQWEGQLHSSATLNRLMAFHTLNRRKQLSEDDLSAWAKAGDSELSAYAQALLGKELHRSPEGWDVYSLDRFAEQTGSLLQWKPSKRSSALPFFQAQLLSFLQDVGYVQVNRVTLSVEVDAQQQAQRWVASFQGRYDPDQLRRYLLDQMDAKESRLGGLSVLTWRRMVIRMIDERRLLLIGGANATQVNLQPWHPQLGNGAENQLKPELLKLLAEGDASAEALFISTNPNGVLQSVTDFLGSKNLLFQVQRDAEKLDLLVGGQLEEATQMPIQKAQVTGMLQAFKGMAHDLDPTSRAIAPVLNGANVDSEGEWIQIRSEMPKQAIEQAEKGLQEQFQLENEAFRGGGF